MGAGCRHRECFDSIDHAGLLAITHLPGPGGAAKPWLKAGDRGRRASHPTEAGTPQGGMITLLQSCKHGARVLDEYSADTTAPRVWGWVSGGPAPRGARQTSPHPQEQGDRRGTSSQPIAPDAGGSLTFEPSHISPACVVQAYDWVVPIRRRTPSQTLPTRRQAAQA